MNRDAHVARLSAESIDALRYAGRRQLTRWSKRELSPREVQRREALSDALSALSPFRHCTCDLQRLASDDKPRADLSRLNCRGEDS